MIMIAIKNSLDKTLYRLMPRSKEEEQAVHKVNESPIEGIVTDAYVTEDHPFQNIHDSDKERARLCIIIDQNPNIKYYFRGEAFRIDKGERVRLFQPEDYYNNNGYFRIVVALQVLDQNRNVKFSAEGKMGYKFKLMTEEEANSNYKIFIGQR